MLSSLLQDIDVSMNEVITVMDEIRAASTSELDIIYGTGFNPDLQGELIVTVIATGYNEEENKEETPSQSEEVEGRKKREESGEKPGWLI